MKRCGDLSSSFAQVFCALTYAAHRVIELLHDLTQGIPERIPIGSRT